MFMDLIIMQICFMILFNVYGSYYYVDMFYGIV